MRATSSTRSAILTDFDTGTVVIDPDGRPTREWEVVAVDKEIEIAPGVFFPAWTFNGRIPGPTLPLHRGRAAAHPLHQRQRRTRTRCISTASIRGAWTACRAPAWCRAASEFDYEFDAYPFGCHLYHCHALPLKRHIHKGMYGAFIIDPDPARHPEAADVARAPPPRHAGECRAGRNS